MIDIAICDDEAVIRGQLQHYIKKNVTDSRIEIYATGEELLAANRNFDLVFLDIQMEGLSGMEAARSLRANNKDTIIIFVTGSKEYVFEAFDVSAFHYLLKPLAEEKLDEILKRALEEVSRRKIQDKKQLLIQTRSRNYSLDQSTIFYLESRGKKVEIHTPGETIEVYASISKLEEQMGSSFYRCHRGYLVNLAYIAEYRTDRIRLSNGDEVYLAREKYQSFVKTYMRYLQNGGAIHGSTVNG